MMRSVLDSTSRLQVAVQRLINTSDEPASATVLWSMSYTSNSRPASAKPDVPYRQDKSGRIMAFPPLAHDLAFDDTILDSVKAIWSRAMGSGVSPNEFMKFDDRRDANEDADD